MNEVQGKPKRKWLKKLSIVIFPLILICVIAFIIVLSTGQEYEDVDHGPVAAYRSVQDEIQNAVTGYVYNHNGSLPTLSGIYSNANCSNCSVINISALLEAKGGFLRKVPLGTYGNNQNDGSNNCASNPVTAGCEPANHYIWLVDDNGSVYSYCTGSGCATNNSGLQCAYPWENCPWP